MSEAHPLPKLVIAALLACALWACGEKDKTTPQGSPAAGTVEPSPQEEAPPAVDKASPGGEATDKGAKAQPESEAPPNPDMYKVRDDHPKTEEALLKAIADSVRQRNIDRMRTFTSPEATADLERIYAGDRNGFWMRADVFRNDIDSGLTIVHRDDDTKPTWRVLVKFGNGVEETMTFARIDGHLKIDVF